MYIMRDMQKVIYIYVSQQINDVSNSNVIITP